MAPYLHGYLCECTRPRCRETIRMTDEQHRRLRSMGAVVSNRCPDSYSPRVIARGPGYVILHTSTAKVAA